MENTGILMVHCDHVGSNQLQQIRIALRGRATVLMGKNTQIRRVLRNVSEDYPDLIKLLPHVIGNVGLIFTNDDIKQIRDVITGFKVPAAAKPGNVAPVDVYVPPGPTGLDPGQTSFFQALGIATKIARGSIEIINRVHLIKEGDKVGSSEVALLSKLGIKPFTYGLIPTQIYDTGSVYSPKVLDLTEADMLSKFFRGVSYVAAMSLALGVPTVASVPHSLSNAFKKLVSVALATDYTFEQAQIFKEMLENPDAFAAPADNDEKEVVADAEPEEEDDDESESDVGGGGLFGDDSDDSDSD